MKKPKQKLIRIHIGFTQKQYEFLGKAQNISELLRGLVEKEMRKKKYEKI